MCERMKMEAPTSSSHLQNILRRSVQTVQWTYTIYWKFCSPQRVLVWGDGYYNGAIKTRKTVQLKEVSAEEASLHRSQQLRELYETLCAGEANQQSRRPSAALSPEDLTETEWFYMMCFSYYFPLAVGLPGRAYAKRQHVWLTGANGVDSQVFSRAILAKQSAQIQTVVCIPLLDGVVELGTTEKVREDLGLIQQIINFFIQSHESQQAMHPPPKQALSEHSASNPPTFTGFRSSDVIASTPAEYITLNSHEVAADTNNQTEKEEEEEEDGSSGDLSDTSIFNDIISSPLIQNPNSIGQSQTQIISEQMQIDDMDSDYHILGPATQIGNQETIGTDENEYLGKGQEEDLQIQPSSFSPSPSGISSFHELAQEEDTHYSKTVAIILPDQSSRCSGISSPTNFIHPSPHSSFFKCSSAGYSASDHLFSGSSQSQLKYILFTVPFLHSKDSGGTSQKDSYPRKSVTPQEVIMGGANHVLAERRRREKLNERFIMLRSLVPFVTKMDKASILGDTIEYVKQLRNKIEELEARAKQVDQCTKENKNNNEVKEQSMIKKKMRMDRGSGGGKLKGVTGNEEAAVQVEVSIIENNALVELQCRYREGLLLDIMQMLKQLKVEITAVQSSLSKGFFMAELKAKVKENVNGKKVTIMEVKKALLQTVSQQEH